MIIIPIGKPHSGKSTFCKALQRVGLGTYSFAEPLYRMIGEIIGQDRVRELRQENRKEEPIPELQGKTLRYALQTLGTEWGRDLMGPDLWADHLFRMAGTDDFTIDDLRFPNEYEKAKEAGAIFVRIHPLEYWGPEEYAHESESYQEDFDTRFSITWRTLDHLRAIALDLEKSLRWIE